MSSWQSKFVQHMTRMTWDRRVPPGLTAQRLRSRLNRLSAQFGKPDKDIRIVKAAIGQMTAEWLEPRGAQMHRVVLYFHGGGYVMGSLDTHRAIAARLAAASNARALLIDYRLAPEHPFPAALEDGLAAYRWLLHQGLDPRGIAFAGDSSGGGLALAAAVALRDHKAPLPGALVLLSPWTDLALSGRTVLRNADKDSILSLELLAFFGQNYLQGTLPTNPLASPLYAKFERLPPLLIHAGSNEILRDDATRLSEKALRAGVDVSVEIHEGMPHAFQLFEKLPEAEASIERLGQFIKSRTVSVPMRVAAQ